MDTYAEALTDKMQSSNQRINEQWVCCLFADDENLQACSAEVMKKLLGMSEEWAQRAGMRWSPGKSHILVSPRPECFQLTLEEEHIQINHDARYSEVSAPATGVSATSNISRIHNA